MVTTGDTDIPLARHSGAGTSASHISPVLNDCLAFDLKTYLPRLCPRRLRVSHILEINIHA